MTEQKTKHTPGTWKVAGNGFSIYISGNEFFRVATTLVDMGESALNDKILDALRDQQRANARLIAACPMMLEALQVVEWIHIERKGTFCPFCMAYHPIHDEDCKLDAAIKSATQIAPETT